MNDLWIYKPPDIWPIPRSVEIAKGIVAGAPASHQIHFRVRDDTAGLNTDSGWLALEDVNPSAIGTGTANRFRIRFVIDEVNNKLDVVDTPQIYYSKNSGAFAGEEVAINGSSSNVQATLSSQYADGATCSTQLLTSGASGSFNSTTGTADEVDGQVATINFAKDEFCEVEYCIYFVDADVANADEFDFRVYHGSAGGPIEGYSATPRITVSKAPPPAWETGGLLLLGVGQ
jgi:hypothetical protein